MTIARLHDSHSGKQAWAHEAGRAKRIAYVEVLLDSGWRATTWQQGEKDLLRCGRPLSWRCRTFSRDLISASGHFGSAGFASSKCLKWMSKSGHDKDRLTQGSVPFHQVLHYKFIHTIIDLALAICLLSFQTWSRDRLHSSESAVSDWNLSAPAKEFASCPAA